ncbi:unnamed protein product [Clonostachys rosea]|uniref:AB hydrolase-1 domain-containing protein n=1 Tax=Bionectria ochroleuca TaxID=29856 RepID=A0ABY6U259_BIOOC|nr:unnamed protein product [Clonostachys rosea]
MFGRVLLRFLLALSLAYVALGGRQHHEISRRIGFSPQHVPQRMTWWPHPGDGHKWDDRIESFVNMAPQVNITWLQVDTHFDRIMERAFIKVPRNHWRSRSFDRLPNPNGFMLPVVRLRGKDADLTSNILIIPDGPGIPGTKMVEEQGEELFEYVGEKYNLIGFDARGVGQSDPSIMCPRKVSRMYPKAFLTEKYGDMGREAWNFFRWCRWGTGDHYMFVNTPQVVEDLNIVINGLGQYKVNLWGFGYGTIVGQSYAMRWPEKAGRMIFDSVSDMDQWYKKKYHETRYQDADAVFHARLRDCIDMGSECPLAKYGSTPEKLQWAILTFGQKLDLGHYTFGEEANFTYNHMIVWIYGALATRAKFLEMARYLAEFMSRDHGEPSLIIPAPEIAKRRESDAAIFYYCNDGKSGHRNDYPQTGEQIQDEMLPYVNSSLFGIHSMPVYHVKRLWNDRKRYPTLWRVEPTVWTPFPVLLMSNSMDPFTPISSTKAARVRWQNSKVIQLTTIGHPALGMVSECAKRYIQDYWQKGLLPQADVLCDAEEPPLEKRRDGGKR